MWESIGINLEMFSHYHGKMACDYFTYLSDAQLLFGVFNETAYQRGKTNVTNSSHLPLLTWAFPDSISIADFTELQQMRFLLSLYCPAWVLVSYAQCCPQQAGEREDDEESENSELDVLHNSWKWGSSLRSY